MYLKGCDSDLNVKKKINLKVALQMKHLPCIIHYVSLDSAGKLFTTNSLTDTIFS